jgi:hypothetical protein
MASLHSFPYGLCATTNDYMKKSASFMTAKFGNKFGFSKFFFKYLYSTPFVLGSDMLFTSRLTAILMALANALKMASIL